MPRGNGNTFQSGNYIVLHFGTWQGILCKTVVCLSVYLESTVPQVEEEDAATKQTKVVTFDLPKMTVSDYGTTILPSLHKSNEMKPTDPSVQFENTAFWFHLIALYLWKMLSAPLCFPPTLNSVVELQLSDWSAQVISFNFQTGVVVSYTYTVVKSVYLNTIY